MGRFELASDFVINHTLKPHVGTNFHVLTNPGGPLHTCPDTGKRIYPKILTTGSGDAVHRKPVFDKLISMTGMERPNVVYIGTPFFDRDDKYDSGTASFRQSGCKVKRLMVAKECTTPSPEEMRRIVVDWADIIFVSGGNSLFAMLRWQSIGLDLLLKESALKGTVMCGGSAGCGCWFDSMQTDSLKPEACKLAEKALENLTPEERLDWSFVRISCLGFINAFCVPHLDAVGTNKIARVDIAKKMLLDSIDPASDELIFGLGVDEKAAVIYEEGKISSMSAGPRLNGTGDAGCHVLFVNERQEVLCIPIAAGGKPEALEDIVKCAVISVAAVQCPLDLAVDEDIQNACHRRGSSFNFDMMSIIDDAGVATVTAATTMGGMERPHGSTVRSCSAGFDIMDENTKEDLAENVCPIRGLLHNSSFRSSSHSRTNSVNEGPSDFEGVWELELGLPPLVEGKRLVEPTSTSIVEHSPKPTAVQ